VQVFSFGCQQLAQQDVTATQLAAQARLKFFNPGKLQCAVTFKLSPLDASGTAEECPFAMDIKEATIAPNEECFVTISFRPRQVEIYHVKLEALAGDGADASQHFSCNLKVPTALHTIMGIATHPKSGLQRGDVTVLSPNPRISKHRA
jgi:hypothetical protein